MAQGVAQRPGSGRPGSGFTVSEIEIKSAMYLTILREDDDIIGVYFIPPRGGWEWHAGNGDWGTAATEEECI